MVSDVRREFLRFGRESSDEKYSQNSKEQPMIGKLAVGSTLPLLWGQLEKFACVLVSGSIFQIESVRFEWQVIDSVPALMWREIVP